MQGNNNNFEKKLSSKNIWALALGSIIGWGAFVMPGTLFLKKAGPIGAVIALSLATLIMVIIAFNYQFMITRFPVAGGEFKYADIVFGEKHAFICAWFLSLSYIAIVPLNATALALIGRNLLQNIFKQGYLYSIAGYDIYLGEIVLAISAIIILGIVSIKGVKTAGNFQTLLVFALVSGVLIVFIAAIVNPEAHIIDIKPQFSPSISPVSGILSIIVVAPWAFVGFDTIPQASEEFNFSHNKAIIAMVASIVFAGVVYILLSLTTAAVIPDGYTDWYQYIVASEGKDGVESLPTFFAAKSLLGNAGLLIIGIAVLAAILSGIMGFYMASSRLIYSMAKEKVLPGFFGEIHPKFKTPKNAIIFVMICSIFAPLLGRNALEWIVNMSSIGAVIGFGYTSACTLKISYLEKKWIMFINGFTGLIISILFIVFMLVPIPLFNCNLSKESYICLVIWIVLGAVFYFKRKK